MGQKLTDAKPQIACFTETWITDESAPVYKSQLTTNHHMVSSERPKNPDGNTGGGTMILVDRDYVSFIDRIEPPEYVQSPYFAKTAQGVLELSIARFRPCRLPREFTTVIVACVYIPEYTNDKARQANAVYRLLDAMGKVIADNGKPLIYICGDFNGADTTTITSNLDLRQLNHEPTRGTKVLDIILSNAPNCYKVSTQPAIDRSDHKVVVASTVQEMYKSTRPTKTKRLVRTGKIRDTVEQLRRSTWIQTTHG